jgi:hypothetical protein
MNRVAFDIRLVNEPLGAPSAWNYFALDIFLDDQNLLELVREAERPFAAAEGHPKFAGCYAALPADLLLAELDGQRVEKVSLYDCQCGCYGCWPLRVRISKSEDLVIWSEFEQPHRRPFIRTSWWRYDKLGPFKFVREQYVAALAKAESELRGHRTRLADAVAEVLRESGALRPREIAQRLRRRGWGNPPVSAVNQVLTQYLAGRAKPCGGGRWASCPAEPGVEADRGP